MVEARLEDVHSRQQAQHSQLLITEEVPAKNVRSTTDAHAQAASRHAGGAAQHQHQAPQQNHHQTAEKEKVTCIAYNSDHSYVAVGTNRGFSISQCV